MVTPPAAPQSPYPAGYSAQPGPASAPRYDLIFSVVLAAILFPLGGLWLYNKTVGSQPAAPPTNPATWQAPPPNPTVDLDSPEPAGSSTDVGASNPDPAPVGPASRSASYSVGLRHARILATSTRSGYSAKDILDGRRDTSWAEGGRGGGIGESIGLYFIDKQAHEITAFSLIPGYDKDSQGESDEYGDRWYLNDRLTRAAISGDGFRIIRTFDPDTRDYQSVPELVGRRTSFLKIEILGVKKGNFKREEDLCISEIQIEVND